MKSACRNPPLAFFLCKLHQKSKSASFPFKFKNMLSYCDDSVNKNIQQLHVKNVCFSAGIAALDGLTLLCSGDTILSRKKVFEQGA